MSLSGKKTKKGISQLVCSLAQPRGDSEPEADSGMASLCSWPRPAPSLGMRFLVEISHVNLIPHDALDSSSRVGMGVQNLALSRASSSE